MTTIHYPAKSYDKLNRQQLLQLAYALEDTRDRALRRLEAIEGKPGADWRCVIRAFLKIGPYLLERRTTDGNRYWRYETNKRSKGGLRELVDILHFPTESMWIIKLGIYGDTHMVSLKNPTPAEVFIAARLVGLTGSES